MATPITIVLSTPVQFGKDAEPICELVLKPTARSFREVTIPIKDDGTVLFQPYELAKVGVKLAGHPAAVLDLMDVVDMMEVAVAVMGFLSPSQRTGTAPLQ